jgi:hypothetical protein
MGGGGEGRASLRIDGEFEGGGGQLTRVTAGQPFMEARATRGER